jgi:hypothetical protein
MYQSSQRNLTRVSPDISRYDILLLYDHELTSEYLNQLRSFAFNPDHYPGYAHRRTAGHKGDRELPILKEREGVTDARTWEFELIVSTKLMGFSYCPRILSHETHF